MKIDAVEGHGKDLRTTSRKFWLFLIFCGLLGLSYALVGYELVRSWVEHEIKVEFTQKALEFDNRIQQSLTNYHHTLDSVAAFYKASQFVDRNEFHQFTMPLLERNSGIVSLGWVPKVEASQLQAHIEDARKRGLSDYEIHEMVEGNAVAVAARSVYFPLLYAEPYDARRIPIGVDMASNYKHLMTFYTARESGQLTATSTMSFSDTAIHKQGIFIIKAIYKNGLPASTKAERQANLYGFAIAVLPMSAFLESAFNALEAEGIDLYLQDVSPRAESRYLGSYSATNSRATSQEEAQRNRLHEALYTGDIEFGGRQWQILAYPTDLFYATQGYEMAWMLYGCGLMISLMMLVYAYSMVKHSIEGARYMNEILTSRSALEHQARFDSLTNLVNRGEFDLRLQRALASVQEHNNRYSVLYLDLDQFKVINDTCGHSAGDQLLQELAKVLKSKVRNRDTLSRLGGDEFALILESCDLEQAEPIANKLREAVKQFRFNWQGRVFEVSVSIGVVSIRKDHDSIARIMSTADMACYMAKDMGRNRVYLCREDDEELLRRQGDMSWFSRITTGIRDKRLVLYQQTIEPLKATLDDGKHIEILVRMIDEAGQLVAPGAFLPAAERFNLMTKVDRQVVESTLEFFSNEPLALSELTLCSINLSGQSLGDEEFLDYLLNAFERYRVPYEKICFEITESVAISQLHVAMKFMQVLKERGCCFALDDFGSGMSSLGYLKQIPVDYLKIDGLFVKEICNDPINRTLVKSMSEIGHIMGIKTVGVFVETDEIKYAIKEIGVDYGQGFGIAKPAPLSNLSSSHVSDSVWEQDPEGLCASELAESKKGGAANPKGF